MPSAPIRKTSAPSQLREKNSGQAVPSQQLLPKNCLSLTTPRTPVFKEPLTLWTT
jgi:hypothetical protein